jgi:Phytanoyl-CoA hydroxylase-interacting protein C-terminus
MTLMTCLWLTTGSQRYDVSELTMSDLQTLYRKAVDFNGQSSMIRCNWLYRNRWKSYFDDVMDKQGGIMDIYVKDNSGDQASPINSQLNGLFFMAKNVNGNPPRDSPFGRIRLQVPAEVLLDLAPNLYFTDFYCMRGSMHYVTLVMTKPNSTADLFCRDRLLQLDINDRLKNPFLFRHRGKLYTANRKKLNIELFYTEDIDVNVLVADHGARVIKDVPVPKNCKGRSTPGGVPKNKTCTLCNL